MRAYRFSKDTSDITTKSDAIKSNRSPQDFRVIASGFIIAAFFFIVSAVFVSLVKESSPQIDSLLEPLVQMSGAEETDVLLSQLIAVHAEPVINGIIRYLRATRH